MPKTFIPMVRKAPKPLGFATHPSYLELPGYGDAAAQHMRILVPEVAGKYGYVKANGWGDMDALYAWAHTYGKRTHYHALLWWWEFPPDPEAWIREAMGRYPYIPDWDVCNEAWDASGNPLYPFIEDSYRLCRTLTSARLWYNGILDNPAEQDNALALIQDGLADGIGIEMHLGLDPDLSKYTQFIAQLSMLGITWRVSELDVMISALTPEELARQAAVYGQVRQMLEGYGGESGTTWGMTDNTSWRKAYYPLCFDAAALPKPCWDSWRGVVNV